MSDKFATVTPIRRSRPDEVVTEIKYVERGGETCRVKHTTGRPVRVQPICNFVACVVERRETRGGNRETTVEYVIDVTREGVTASVVVAAATPLAFTKTVPGLYVEANCENYVAEAVQRSAADAPTVLGYACTGWILAADGASLFLHGDGALGADGPVADVRAVLDHRLAAYRFPPAPDAERLAAQVRETVDVFCGAADRRITLPLLACVARAPLGSPTHFVVHLAGETGAGKTSLARFAASFFGAELARPDAPVFSFAGTANALEVGLSNAGDVVAVVDDYLGTRAQQTTADRLTRSATGGVRDRLHADLTARPSHSPKGLIVSTGEDAFDRASAQARTLTVPLAPSMQATPEAFDRARTAALSGTFASTTGAYVQHLASERDRNGVDADGMAPTWATNLTTVHRNLTATIARSGAKVHPRGVEIVAELVAAFGHFAAWAEHVGAFNAAEAKQLTGEAWSTLLGLLDTAADEAAQIMTMLGEALASGRCHVVTRAGQPPQAGAGLLGWSPGSGFTEPRPSGPRIGFVHDDVIDLIPDAFIDMLRGAQRRTGSEPNLTRKRVATLLHDRGWLQHDDARSTYGTRRRIGDRQVPVWPIALDVVFGVETFTDDTDPDVVRASLLVRDQLDAIAIEPVAATNTERSAETSPHANEAEVLL